MEIELQNNRIENPENVTISVSFRKKPPLREHEPGDCPGALILVHFPGFLDRFRSEK